LNRIAVKSGTELLFDQAGLVISVFKPFVVEKIYRKQEKKRAGLLAL
jgi:hypothetical protein